MSDIDWDISEFADMVMSFIATLCNHVSSFPNQKPWVDGYIRNALNACTAAYNSGLVSGHMDEYKVESYGFRRALKGASAYGRGYRLSQITGAEPPQLRVATLCLRLAVHDCVARSSSNTIVKFADDTVVEGLISGNDIRGLTHHCGEGEQLQVPGSPHRKGSDLYYTNWNCSATAPLRTGGLCSVW